MTPTIDSYRNVAEISNALDDNDVTGDDQDSTPDDNPNNNDDGEDDISIRIQVGENSHDLISAHARDLASDGIISHSDRVRI